MLQDVKAPCFVLLTTNVANLQSGVHQNTKNETFKHKEKIMFCTDCMHFLPLTYHFYTKSLKDKDRFYTPAFIPAAYYFLSLFLSVTALFHHTKAKKKKVSVQRMSLLIGTFKAV